MNLGVCSSSVASLKTVVRQWMMIRVDEDLQLTDDLVDKFENALRHDRRLIVNELSATFPQIPRSLLHEVITETLV